MARSRRFSADRSAESAATPSEARGGSEPKALETKRCSVGRFSFDYFPLSAQRKVMLGSGAGTAPGIFTKNDSGFGATRLKTARHERPKEIILNAPTKTGQSEEDIPPDI